MALFLEKQLSSGVNVTYHKITRADINFLTDICSFTIGYYISKEFREDKSDPVCVEGYNTPLTLGSDIRQTIYEYLKTTVDYKDSKDI